MENANFTFVIGDPAEDAAGRSVTGRVYINDQSWDFEADLVRRWSPTRYQFNRVALKIGRPFDIFEFCFFYSMVSSGRFQTNTGTGRISAASESELPLVDAVYRTIFKVPEQAGDLSEVFRDDIALMEEKLERLRKSEMLQLAWAGRKEGESVTILLDG